MGFFFHATNLLGSRRVEEKKAYWRLHGAERFTPLEAAIHARDELAAALLAASKNDERIRAKLGEVAYSIVLYAPKGVSREEAFQRLPEEWQAIYLNYIADENARHATYKKVTEEKFAPDELNRAWNRLLQLDIPEDFQKLWDASWERTHVADLLNATGLDTRELALWMRVLVDHGLGWWPDRMFKGFQHKLQLPNDASEDVRRLGRRLGLE